MSLKPLHKPGIFFSAILIAILQLFIYKVPLYGQEDCATKIQEAKKYYDQGMIEEIPKILAPCMADGFTRMQRIEGYKLIILSYLFDDNQFEAERTMLEFLKKYPEYEIMPNDPIEFIYLFESYRTTSVFSFGFTAGFNLTDPRIIEPFTTFDLHEVTLKNTMKPGFQVGFGVGGYIGRDMLLNLELVFSSNQYKFSDEIRNSLIDGESSVVYDGISSVEYTEKLYKLALPVTVAYEFNIKKMNYFVCLGASAAKITGVSGEPTRKFHKNIQALPGENKDMREYRKNMLYSGIIGGGIRYKVPRGVISLSFRANLGINNIVLSDKRNDNEDFINNFYYLDDDFSINTFSLSAGYYFSFYQPKKQR